MGRGISELLLSLLPNMDVSAFVYPNATFDQCLNSVEPLCSSLTKNDFVFILCGTNDTTSLAPNSCPRLDLNKIKRLQMKTNVIVSSIMYRHDMYVYQNTNIHYTNQYLQHKCRTLNVNYYHSNDYIQRRHYTRHGLHLNNAGKRMLSIKLKEYILSHLVSIEPVSSQTIPDISVSSNLEPADIMNISCPYSMSPNSTFGEIRPRIAMNRNDPVNRFFPELAL
ncbi:hypothetical protein M8J75_013357 [Diaphorina citri]|nr:hypothetical protein M8J75_013357 [Diaphorina citri]